MDDRLYPQGRGGLKSKYNSAGDLVFYTAAGVEVFRISATIAGGYVIPGTVKHLRQRCSAAEINAGVTLLAAVVGFKYRLVDASAIAIGGNAGSVTSVDILGTLSASSRKLVAFLVAGLTRSTLLRAGAATNGVILADGASYTQNDAATAITVLKTGSDIDTATHVDISLSYCLEV